MERGLSGFDLWMVKCNLEYASKEVLAPVVARLRAGGYQKVANAVEIEFEKLSANQTL